MVDIRSIVGSSHPSHRGQGSEQEATSSGRSHRMNACNATMVVTRRQHSTATMAVMPLGASPKGTLEAARVLLNNPPGLGTSPSAAEQ
jgi:hypothetical protein